MIYRKFGTQLFQSFILKALLLIEINYNLCAVLNSLISRFVSLIQDFKILVQTFKTIFITWNPDIYLK